MNSLRKNSIYIIRFTENGLEFKHSRKMLWIYLAVLLPILGLFIFLFTSLEDIGFKIIFVICFSFFAILSIFIILNTFKYNFTINKNGVFEKNIFSSKKLEWQYISEIGICVNKINKQYSQYYNELPQTTMYFCKRHLTDDQKKDFYKDIPIKKQMIYIEHLTCKEFDEVCEIILEYIKKYTDLPITRFNSYDLKHNL